MVKEINHVDSSAVVRVKAFELALLFIGEIVQRAYLGNEDEREGLIRLALTTRMLGGRSVSLL